MEIWTWTYYSPEANTHGRENAPEYAFRDPKMKKILYKGTTSRNGRGHPFLISYPHILWAPAPSPNSGSAPKQHW